MTVPENRARPDGRTVRLAVAVVPAVSPNVSAVPVVFLNGGPGAESLGAATELIQGGFNRSRPLVLISQRGTQTSSIPLTCPEIDNFRADSVGSSFAAPATVARYLAATKACQQRLAATADLSAFNDTESTADLVAVQQALGISTWDVMSHSYGTDLALIYLRLHPQGIHSVVIDGTVPPSQASLGWTWSSLEESFDNIVKACAAQPACNARYPDTRATFLRQVQQLQAHPITTTVTIPSSPTPIKVWIDGNVLVNWLARASHDAQDVPAMIDELAHGQPQRLATMWAEARVLPPSARGMFAHGLSYSVWCAEWIPFETQTQQVRKAVAAFPNLPPAVRVEAPQLAFLRQICKVWNVPAAPKSIRNVTRSPVPTLAISGSFDAQTGAQWGAYAARTLSNSKVVTVPGVAHGVYLKPCGASIVVSFLDNPAAPDTSCISQLPPTPFTVGPGGPVPEIPANPDDLR